jgi:tetratricopeptide (TPR) repeat protein
MLLCLLLLAVSATPAQQWQARIQEGTAALERNDLAKAQASFEQATRIAPGQPGAWLLLAQTYARQKNDKQAVMAARKAEQLGADDPRILQGLANFYATLVPDFPKAASLGARYAEKNPSDATAWQRLASFCLQTGQPEKAIEAGKRGLALDQNAASHSVLGQAYLAQKDFPHAIEELSAALKLNPYSEDSYFRLSQAYLVQLDYDHAIAVLQSARKTFDKSAQIELALGVAYYGQRKFTEAVEQFLRTIRIDPDVPQPYVFLDRMLDHAGDRLNEITALMAEFEKRNPKSPLGYLLHAKAMMAQLPPSEYPAEAETAFALLEKSVAIREDNWDAHFQMGVLLERKKDYQGAAAHLERSIALNAGESAVHFRLARVYERLGRKEDAAKQRELAEQLGEKAIQKKPDAR